MSTDRAATTAKPARSPRALKILETTCATCGADLKLTGTVRSDALKPGRSAYCPNGVCGRAGQKAGRWPDGPQVLEVDCGTCGKHLSLTGPARENAVARGGRAYCSNGVCGYAAISAAMTDRTVSDETREKISAAATAQGADPAERERRSARSQAMWKNPETRARILEAIVSANWCGDAVRYNGRHARLEVTLGRASERLCVDCDRQPADWSLNPGTAPKYLRADDTGPDQGRPFSLLDEADSARCRSCHIRLDKGPGIHQPVIAEPPARLGSLASSHAVPHQIISAFLLTLAQGAVVAGLSRPY